MGAFRFIGRKTIQKYKKTKTWQQNLTHIIPALAYNVNKGINEEQ